LHNVYLKYFCPKNTISCGGFGLLVEYLVVLKIRSPLEIYGRKWKFLAAKLASRTKI